MKRKHKSVVAKSATAIPPVASELRTAIVDLQAISDRLNLIIARGEMDSACTSTASRIALGLDHYDRELKLVHGIIEKQLANPERKATTINCRS